MPPFLHLLPNAWFFLGGFHRHRRILRRILRRRASGVEVSFLRKPLMGSSGRNLFRGPLSGPSNPVIPYPVVRLTFKAPVPDRRVERNRLAVKNELPIRGTERRNDAGCIPGSTAQGRATQTRRNSRLRQEPEAWSADRAHGASAEPWPARETAWA